MQVISRLIPLIALTLSLAGCAGLAVKPQPHPSQPRSAAPDDELLERSDEADRSSIELTVPSAPSPRSTCDEVVLPFQRDEPFRQVSWMATDADSSLVYYRIPTGSADDWTPWQTVEVSFEEGRAYNARILLPEPASFLELRGDLSLASVHVSFQPHVTARTTPRSSPLRECGNRTRPRRISFHHTATEHGPDADDAAIVRQIRSFHINERGWCDVGYHFLITRSGEVFAGRARTDRTGAHVAGQNDGNLGVAFVGDFTVEPPTSAQIDAAIALTRRLHLLHKIPLTRDAVRGHHEWPGQKTRCPGDKFNVDDLDTIAFIVERAALDPATSPTLVSENRLTADAGPSSPR
jgi:hypothetical protein